MRLLPRQEKFFHLFVDQSSLIVAASQCLLEAARQGNSAIRESAERIEKLEEQGDTLLHKIFDRLNETFITPVDPEDIHNLSSHLDDVLDAIEESAHRMAAYRLDPVPRAVLELCEIIEGCALATERAMQGLEKKRDVNDSCRELNQLEEKADRLVRKSIAELFEKEKDPIHLIKCKEVYEFLEEATDLFVDVADVLQNVLVKNS